MGRGGGVGQPIKPQSTLVVLQPNIRAFDMFGKRDACCTASLLTSAAKEQAARKSVISTVVVLVVGPAAGSCSSPI